GSDLRISCNDNGATFDRIAPNVFEAMAPDKATAIAPSANIDLVQDRDFGATNDNATFTLTDTSGATIATRGGLLNVGVPGATTYYSIVLQRRANLNRTGPIGNNDNDAENLDNPWITVDRIGTLDPNSGLITDGVQ